MGRLVYDSCFQGAVAWGLSPSCLIHFDTTPTYHGQPTVNAR